MIKQLFSKPSVNQLATKELYDAEQALLQAQTGLEYAKAMVEYNTNRVARLKRFIAETQPEVMTKPQLTPQLTQK